MQQVNAAIAAGTWPAAYNSSALYTWGQNTDGQLGLGNTTNYSSPKQVGTGSTWLSIASGYRFTVVVKADGTLWTWGSNSYGKLGLGNTTYYSSPKQVGALTSWLKVSCGYGFTTAIKSNGTLWSWGRGSFGALGLGGSSSYSSPKQVGALTNWSTTANGFYFTLAVKTDGTLWGWGRNDNGQLGLGNLTYSFDSPNQVGSLTNWSSVGCTDLSSISVKTDGTLWSWGSNQFGQLGLSSAAARFSSPVQVGGDTNWKNIFSNNYDFFATKTTNSLWAIGGRNNSGQLGLGNTTDYSSPVQIGALTNWSTGDGGEYYTTAVKTNGTLWTWGRNNLGQLGLGDSGNYTFSRSSPTQVGSLTTWLKVSAAGYHTTAISS
jgi:alpha-tubulin suppressor-like RCC1 family protein